MTYDHYEVGIHYNWPDYANAIKEGLTPPGLKWVIHHGDSTDMINWWWWELHPK